MIVGRERKESKSFVSFKDCPNHCTDGWLYNPFGNPKKTLCKFCEKKRIEFSKGGVVDEDGKDIAEVLNIPHSCYTGVNFNVESVIPEVYHKDIEKDSLQEVYDKLKDLMREITIGIIPNCSLIFNLGKKVNEMNFIYPYMVRAYQQGVSMLPLIDAKDIHRMRIFYETNIDGRERFVATYEELVDKDLCVVSIDAGATDITLNAVKGLMQVRARQCKPTIIFTNAWDTRVQGLCNESGENNFHLAKLYSIHYIDFYKREGIRKDTSLFQSNKSKKYQGFNDCETDMRNLLKATNTI